MSKKRRSINEPKFTITALSYLLRFPLLLGGLGLLGYGFHLEKALYQQIGFGLIGAAILVTIIFFGNANSVNCRLCRAQFFKKLRCVKKPNTPTILGSSRLPLAFTILARRPSIHCPYCGEKRRYFGKRG